MLLTSLTKIERKKQTKKTNLWCGFLWDECENIDGQYLCNDLGSKSGNKGGKISWQHRVFSRMLKNGQILGLLTESMCKLQIHFMLTSLHLLSLSFCLLSPKCSSYITFWLSALMKSMHFVIEGQKEKKKIWKSRQSLKFYLNVAGRQLSVNHGRFNLKLGEIIISCDWEAKK